LDAFESNEGNIFITFFIHFIHFILTRGSRISAEGLDDGLQQREHRFAVRAIGEHAAVAEEQQIPLRDLHQGKRICARDDGEGDGGENRVHQVAAEHTADADQTHPGSQDQLLATALGDTCGGY
jgi:hypothetical protein